MRNLSSVRKFSIRKISIILLVFGISILTNAAHAAQVQGSMEKWAPLTLEFIGPQASEVDQNPNPFLDYRLSVKLTAPSGNTYTLPGFFAGDGNGAGVGNRWQARFSADEVGLWRYEASLSSGTGIAINTDLSAGSSMQLPDSNGEFYINHHSLDAPGFLKYGRLDYVGGHYLKFSDGPYWLKGGTDSPENFLGYAGFDGTVDHGGENHIHYYELHRGDARADDPVFSNSQTGADSLGITGALNYLANEGVNSIYFLPMNLGGDGQETYPFVGGSKTTFNKTHYDISKLHQWNQVLSHAQRRGIALNIVLSETERNNERWLDDGAMGTERKLFFRELIARFGYLLAAKWNLGEENDFSVAELRKHAAYLKQLDWSQKPIAVHTQINNFRDYEQLMGDSLFTASSIQYDHEFASDFVEQWRSRSANAGQPWVIDMDENTGGIKNQNASIRRKQILYDVFFSGGNIEWYFGYHPQPIGGDITASDFRQRSEVWKMTRYAREFVEQNLPFWRMEPADNLVSAESSANGGAEVFAAKNEVYAVYLPNASGSPKLDLRNASGNFSLRWFNPASGQFEGNTSSVNAGSQISIGSPPSRTNDDWVVLLQSPNAQQLLQEQLQAQLSNANATINANSNPTANTADSTPDENSNASSDAEPEQQQMAVNTMPQILANDNLPEATRGSNYQFTVAAIDPDGAAPVVTADTLPAGMQITNVIDGVATIDWTVPSTAENTVSFSIKAIDVADGSMQVSKAFTIGVISAPIDVETSNPQPDDVSSAAGTENNSPDSAQADTNLENTSQINSNDNPEDLPPYILGAENLTTTAGETVRFTIAPVDPEGVVPAVRTATLPQNAQFIDNGNGTRDFVWTPTQSDIGDFSLRFIATDAGATPHVVQSDMVLTVTDEPSPSQNQTGEITTQRNFRPVIIPVQDQQVSLGSTVSFRVRTIDADGKPPNLHVEFMPPGSSFEDNGDGSRTFFWQPNSDYVGNLNLRFIAIDHEDYSVSSTQDVMIKVKQ